MLEPVPGRGENEDKLRRIRGCGEGASADPEGDLSENSLVRVFLFLGPEAKEAVEAGTGDIHAAPGLGATKVGLGVRDTDKLLFPPPAAPPPPTTASSALGR